MDQLYLLRQALALAQHRNFARAAESLGIAQPSLTRGIAALEHSLGVPLFERTRQGAVPTAFGRVLLERGEALLRSHADLRRELKLLADLEEGSLAIGAGPYAAETSVAEAVARTLRAHPRLRIECTIADPDRVIQDVLAGHLDLGVARHAGLEHESRLKVEALPALRIYLACRAGHPLTREDRPSLARILEFPLATTRLRGAQALLARTARTIKATDRSRDDEFVPQVVVNSLGIARLIARGSDAIVPGTAAHLADDLAAGRLVKLDYRAAALETPHGVFYLRDRPLAPAASAFIATLRAVEEEARRADGKGAGSGGKARSRARPRPLKPSARSDR